MATDRPVKNTVLCKKSSSASVLFSILCFQLYTITVRRKKIYERERKKENITECIHILVQNEFLIFMNVYFYSLTRL